MEELQARHRKEQRDLQSRVTQKKKNATKKTRKGVNDECDVLQRDLDERQRAELAALAHGSATSQLDEPGVNSSAVDMKADLAVPDGAETSGRSNVETKSLVVSTTASTDLSKAQTKKPNRQKARLARRAAEQDAQAAEAAAEAANLPDRREQEMAAMQRHMDERGLREISIRPDGHCLYSAVASQLAAATELGGTPQVTAYQTVRDRAADFISSNADDFSPFLEEPLESYVHKIKHTAEWGGQLELQAIARAYGVEINVLQSDGRVEKIGPDTKLGQQPIWLAYYRHSFGLGEHYNALQTG